MVHSTENEPPVFVSPTQLSFVKGERLQFQLNATDPEGGPITFSSNLTTGNVDSNLTDNGVWFWTVPVRKGIYKDFTFYAIDECGGMSSPYSPVIEVKDCGCPHGEPCSPDQTYPHGSGHYICHCVVGYTGKRCETDLDECESNPCVNGTCVDVINGFQCNCDNGYEGDQCDVNIDECSSSPCFLGVNCTDLIFGFSCGACPDGYQGDGMTCTGGAVTDAV